MSDFSEALSSIIRNNNISVYGLAKTIQCERTGFQKIMSGDRKMDLKTYCALSRELTDKLNQSELRELYEKFAQEYYGDYDYKRILYIKKRLKDTRKTELYITQAVEKGFSVEDYLYTFDISEKDGKTVRQIYRILEQAFDNAAVKGCRPMLYVNLPSMWGHLTHLLLIFLNVRQIKGNVDLKYLFSQVEADGQEGHKEKELRAAADIRQIEDFITASEFAAYGYNTYETEQPVPRGLSEAMLMPYYLITDQAYVTISYDGSLIIESNDENKIQQVAQKFREMVAAKTEFLKVVNPDVYSSVILARDFNKEGNVFDVVNRICVAAFYTRDILQKIVPQDYPDRNFAIETVGMFYGSLLNQTITMYFTVDSVRHFMESDDSKMEGQYFNLQFTPEIKLELLKSLYNYFSQSVDSRIHMLKEPILSNEMHIFGWDSKIVCACQYLYMGDTPVDAMSFVYNPVVTGHFERYNEYIMNSDNCLDKENSLKVLKNLIQSYE